MIKSNSIRHIKKIAESIALEYDIKQTPLDLILEDEEIPIFYDLYGINTFDGMTVYDGEDLYIHINTDNGNGKTSERGRFTLAHELGHYFIDSHRIGLKQGLLKPHPSKGEVNQYNKIEREADYFASCLLMPEEKLKMDINRKKFNFELIEHLRLKYGVSRTACAIRFAEIGNHPIMVVYAENNIIKWRRSSLDFPYKYMLYDNNVSPDSVMGEYFLNINSEIFKTEEIWAVDIFKYVNDKNVSRKFYEHCITHKNKALSLIWED